MATALMQLKKELSQAEAQLATLPIAVRIANIKQAITVLSHQRIVRKRRMSAETRALLSAAARKRWGQKPVSKAAKAVKA